MEKQKERLKSAFCKNGHLQTTILRNSEKFLKKYCTKCGSEIIDTCLYCKSPILGGYGYYREKRNIYYELIGHNFIKESANYKEIPYYCHNCGKPYPWTEKFLNDYKTLLNLYEDEIESKLSETIYFATENLLKDKFSTSSLNAVILKKCFNKLSDLTKLVFINAVSGFAGESLKNYFLSSAK